MGACSYFWALSWFLYLYFWPGPMYLPCRYFDPLGKYAALRNRADVAENVAEVSEQFTHGHSQPAVTHFLRVQSGTGTRVNPKPETLRSSSQERSKLT